MLSIWTTGGTLVSKSKLAHRMGRRLPVPQATEAWAACLPLLIRACWIIQWPSSCRAMRPTCKCVKIRLLFIKVNHSIESFFQQWASIAAAVMLAE